MKNSLDQESLNLEIIFDLPELPIYFKHLTKVEFAESNIVNVEVVKSAKYQTDQHRLAKFYKPIIKIVE